MTETSLKNRIENYMRAWKIQNPEHWVHKGLLEQKAKDLGFLAENQNRRCRELVEEGILEERRVGKPD